MSKKRFCIMQILIAIMLILAILANTYAWAEGGSEAGYKLSLNYEAAVNGSTVTAETYLVGTVESINEGAEYKLSESGTLQFETVLTNTGSVPCNISLFLRNVICVAGFTVRVSSPGFESYDFDDVVVYDWIRVVSSCHIGAGETITVQWCVDISAAAEFTIGAVTLEHF